MKKRNKILGMMSGSLAVMLTGSAVGQTTNTPQQPGLQQRPVVVPPSTPPERPTVPTRPERPAVPGKPAPTKDVKELVKDFQTARESFRKQQLELNRQLKTATDEQRALIRQQIQENLDQWREEQRSRVEDLREQARGMKDEMRGLKDVIDSGANPNSGGGRPRQ